MNYGYDAQGNRVVRDGEGHGSDGDVDGENARVQAVVGAGEARDGDRIHGNGGRANEEEGGASSSADDNSEFSDDVELVIGETGNQPMDQPLVESVEVSRAGRFRSETEAFLQLEAKGGSRAEGGPQQQPLLIGDRKGPLTRQERERLQAKAFLETVSRVPGRVHTVALAGTLHHGKTALLQMLLDGKSYTPRKDEEDRCISLKAHVLSALVAGAQLCKTTHLVTFVDTPGHPDFIGEVSAGVRLADAVLFCVDALESLDSHGERLLRQLIQVERLPVILVVTKVDRLVLELKLPPLDAYRKLRMVAEAVNNVIASCCGAGSSTTGPAAEEEPRSPARFLVSPENGTVLFSSAKLGFLFSLETFAMKYAAMYKPGVVDFACLAQKLWGQVTFDQGTFKKITNFRERPSFVRFVLEPLYKIIAHAVTGKGAETLSEHLSKLPRSPLSAMHEAVRLFLGNPSGEGIDAVLNVLPATRPRTATLCAAYGLQHDDKLFPLTTGSGQGGGAREDSTHAAAASVAAVAPLISVFTATSDISGSATHKTRKQHRTALIIRVLAGVLKSNPAPPKASARVQRASAAASASPAYVCVDELTDDVNPFHEARLQKLFVCTADKGFVEVAAAYAGQVVYATIDGEESNPRDGPAQPLAAEDTSRAGAGKHVVLVGGPAAAALLSLENSLEEERGKEGIDGRAAEEAEQWLRTVRPWPLPYLGHEPIIHVSVELKDPSALPAFQRGLALLRRTTPGLDLHTEESGEYTMTGFGELHLDTALHQLRTSLCAGVRIGLSQPFVSFAETVLDAEGVLAVAGTRAKGTVGCTSGALPRALVRAVEGGSLDLFPSEATQVAQLRQALRVEFGLDALDAQNVMALGPEKRAGPSLLFDDTLAEERPPKERPLTQVQRNAIIAGFRDAMRSGPLVGETVRGVGVRLIFTEAATEKSVRANELRSSTRLAVRRSLFGARPRLLEPVLEADILCPPECLPKITEILQQRRGAVLGDEAIAATTLTRVKALVPAMDSFGLETQIRMMTHGQAHPMFAFRQWDVVPGDPYDTAVHVGPLEPAKGHQLARDFVLKTRFRKGLSQELTADI